MENEGQVERRAKHLSNESCLAVTLLTANYTTRIWHG